MKGLFLFLAFVAALGKAPAACVFLVLVWLCGSDRR